MISLNAKVVKNEKTAYRVIESEGLIMNPADSTLHATNKTGTFIWEALKTTRVVSELLEDVIQEFDIEEDQARKDLISFLEELSEKKLILIET